MRSQVTSVLTSLANRGVPSTVQTPSVNLAWAAAKLAAIPVAPRPGGLYPTNYLMLVAFVDCVLSFNDVYAILGV